MAFQYLLELDLGYHFKRWSSTGTAGVYSHVFTDIDPVNMYVDGTAYGERTSYAACTGTQSSWYVDRGTAIYVHVVSNGNANQKTIKINSTHHYSRESATVLKSLGTAATVLPIFYEGRIDKVPSISYRPNPDVLGGGIISQIGRIALRNNDGLFDEALGNKIWKNQPARLYAGSSGGTMPADYVLKQSFTIDSPSISRETLEIDTNSDVARLRGPINEGSSITYSSGGVIVTNPAPVVLGPMAGIPAYFTLSTGTVGTYILSAHPLGTVNRVWNAGGTLGTITGNLDLVGRVAAHPISVMGKEVIYVAGTGLIVSVGTPLLKAGEMMKYLLASSAKIATANIDESAFTTIDTDRSINISAWFGRNETIEEGLDAISRTVFSNWFIGRDGKYSTRLIKNKPSNNINNYDFDTVGTLDVVAIGEALENYSTVYPVRVNSSKMLQYTSMLLKDDIAGLALYRGSDSTGSNGRTYLSLRLPLAGTEEQVYCYPLWQSATNYYEYIIGTGTSPSIKLNKNKNGTITVLVNGTPSSAHSGSQMLILTNANVQGAGTLNISILIDGTSLGMGIVDTDIITTGVPALGFGSAGPELNIGTIGAAMGAFGTIFLEYPKSQKTTKWQVLNGLAGDATAIPSAFDKDVVMILKNPGGTAGTLANAQYLGSTSVVLGTGTDYYYSLVAARQSGTATDFRISVKDSAGTEYMGESVSLGTGTWSRVALRIAPTNAGTGTLTIYPNYGGTSVGTVWVDQVEFYPVKSINQWQLKNMRASLINPSNHKIAIRFNGTGTVVLNSNAPLRPQYKDVDARDLFSQVTSLGTVSNMLYIGLEQREASSLTYNNVDADVIGSAVLEYYSRPRIQWEADFLDSQEVTLDLWDTVYIESGRYPGIPDESRLLVINMVEDTHNEGGVPQTRIGGEFVFDAINDIKDIV